jgi:CheY-like chemotaxis protein
MSEPPRGRVLLIDDYRDIAELVETLLAEEGYAVSVLDQIDSDAIRAAVGQLEPDCVLLDGGRSAAGYDQSWVDAAWLSTRGRRVPVVMFSARSEAVKEAQEQTSGRAQAAGFAAIIPKPFDLDELLETVARAGGQSVPFDASARAEAVRSTTLMEKLQAAGAEEIETSKRREWATFRTEHGALVQLYWWQREGVCRVAHYAAASGEVEQIGRFHDVDAAIARAMTVRRDE